MSQGPRRTRCGGGGIKHWMMIGVLSVVLAIAASPRVAMGQAAGRESEFPALPDRLWDALRMGKCESLMRLDWSAVSEFPAVDAAREAGPGLLEGAPVVSTVVTLLANVPLLSSDDVTEVWVQDGGVLDDKMKVVWAQTAMDPAVAQSLLEDAGWWQVPGKGRLFSAPLSRWEAKTTKRLQAQVAAGEEKRDVSEVLDRFSRSHWRVSLTVPGWLVIFPPRRRVIGVFEVHRPGGEAELGAAANFPWEGLLEPMDGALAVIALNLPKNDQRTMRPGAGDGPAAKDLDAAIEKVSGEIRRLRGGVEAGIQGEVGDMLVRITELDGAVAMDLVAKLPGGRGPGACTANVLRLALQFATLASSVWNPDLVRELMDARIAPRGDHLEASVVLSMATVMDAVNRALDRRRRLEELERRLKELMEQRKMARGEH